MEGREGASEEGFGCSPKKPRKLELGGPKTTRAVRLLAGRLTSKSLSPPRQVESFGIAEAAEGEMHSVSRMERPQWMGSLNRPLECL